MVSRTSARARGRDFTFFQKISLVLLVSGGGGGGGQVSGPRGGEFIEQHNGCSMLRLLVKRTKMSPLLAAAARRPQALMLIIMSMSYKINHVASFLFLGALFFGRRLRVARGAGANPHARAPAAAVFVTQMHTQKHTSNTHRTRMVGLK